MEAAALESRDWRLSQLAIDGELAPVADDVRATARFEDGAITGSGGCNRYRAGYTLDGDRISFGLAMSTRMWCGDEAGRVEYAYLQALERAAAWSIDDGALIITDGSRTPLLRFEAAPPA